MDGKIPMSDPKANVREKPHTAGVGNETKADMSVVGQSGLGAAVSHLKTNHASGVPHMPLHGMRPGKGG